MKFPFSLAGAALLLAADHVAAWAGAGGPSGGGGSVPEPASIALFGAGVSALLLVRRLRGRR